MARRPPPRDARPFVPPRPSLTALRRAASSSTGRDLYKNETQAVFGTGPAKARIMLVGEQPRRHREPRRPAFRRPRRAAPIGRARGAREIAACHPWLEAEIAALKSATILCLGATVAKALLRNTVRVTERRGELIARELAPYVMATIHPSALLREPDKEWRATGLRQIIAELRGQAHVARPLNDVRLLQLVEFAETAFGAADPHSGNARRRTYNRQPSG